MLNIHTLRVVLSLKFLAGVGLRSAQEFEDSVFGMHRIYQSGSTLYISFQLGVNWIYTRTTTSYYKILPNRQA